MRIAMAVVVLAGSLALFSAAGGEEGGDCDMKTVEKVFYCEEHEMLLPSQLVSGVTYYVCSECAATSKDSGKCDSCEVALVKKVSGKDVCPECFQKPAQAQACVKTIFECPDCGDTATEAGECEECDVALKKATSRAVIEYVCSECGDFALLPGKCSEKECERFGKPLVKRCSESGTAPHVSHGTDRDE